MSTTVHRKVVNGAATFCKFSASQWNCEFEEGFRRKCSAVRCDTTETFECSHAGSNCQFSPATGDEQVVSAITSTNKILPDHSAVLYQIRVRSICQLCKKGVFQLKPLLQLACRTVRLTDQTPGQFWAAAFKNAKKNLGTGGQCTDPVDRYVFCRAVLVHWIRHLDETAMIVWKHYFSLHSRIQQPTTKHELAKHQLKNLNKREFRRARRLLSPNDVVLGCRIHGSMHDLCLRKHNHCSTYNTARKGKDTAFC